MNQLSISERASAIRSLLNGVSISATHRTTGFNKVTLCLLSRNLGELCAIYLDHALRNLPCKRIQCDEIHSVVQCRAGRVWTWTAICIDTRLVFSWYLGDRTFRSAMAFMRDVRARTSGTVHLTTDQLSSYPRAVAAAFGSEVDFGTVGYEENEDGSHSRVVKNRVFGTPNLSLLHNGFVERQNLTMRETMRRFARRTTGYSKTREAHAAALGLYFMYYNFCRPHMALNRSVRRRRMLITPAMAAGLTTSVWSIEDLCYMLDDRLPIIQRCKRLDKPGMAHSLRLAASPEAWMA